MDKKTDGAKTPTAGQGRQARNKAKALTVESLVTRKDAKVIAEIRLDKDGQMLVVGGPDHPDPPKHLDEPLVGRQYVGVHKFCGGLMRYIQVQEHRGVLACQGGCNENFPLGWPIPNYRHLKVNEPQCPWMEASPTAHSDG